MKRFKKSGQTLVLLLVFMSVAIIVTSAAVVMTIVSSQNTSKLDSGSETYDVAEAGIENALMRLLRDPNYAGETLTVGDGQAIISVGSGTITSKGSMGNFSRTLVVTTSYNNNVLTILSWKEKY